MSQPLESSPSYWDLSKWLFSDISHFQQQPRKKSHCQLSERLQKDAPHPQRFFTASCLLLLNILSALQPQGREAAGQAAALAQNVPSSCLQSSSRSSPPRLLLQPRGSSPLISPSSCSGQPPCLSESPSHLTFILTFPTKDPKAQRQHNARCSSSRYEPNRWAPSPTTDSAVADKTESITPQLAGDSRGIED